MYTLLVTEGLLLLTSAPGLVPLLLLRADASNLPLDAACLVPVGPAASAALFALWRQSGTWPTCTRRRRSGAGTGSTWPACCGSTCPGWS